RRRRAKAAGDEQHLVLDAAVLLDRLLRVVLVVLLDQLEGPALGQKAGAAVVDGVDEQSDAAGELDADDRSRPAQVGERTHPDHLLANVDAGAGLEGWLLRFAPARFASAGIGTLGRLVFHLLSAAGDRQREEQHRGGP